EPDVAIRAEPDLALVGAAVVEGADRALERLTLGWTALGEDADDPAHCGRSYGKPTVQTILPRGRPLSYSRALGGRGARRRCPPVVVSSPWGGPERLRCGHESAHHRHLPRPE